ncbi:MAG TPA: winged helix-turn-helix transcriptional regulator [Candidatus Scatomorpha intestinavium]|uniref:Winged helix-turn-helix transcriptional regulator n=1 Tax=Candidatus Scatomorpha intestinavium TaxID=2840922 RepID=A0A9D1CTG8_9FIRM|nr:winged helix-turn-helix transcriptional regulator [Candidatus Scatomorpha intestinavium]
MDVDLGEMVRDNRYISIQLSAKSDRALAEQGLTGVQATVLLHILENSEGETSLTDLHRELGYSMSAASSLVKRLREKGYISVEGCPLDERRKLLRVTEKGEHVRDMMDSMLKALPDLLFRGFSDEEIQTFSRLQKKMLKNLSSPEDSNLEG